MSKAANDMAQGFRFSPRATLEYENGIRVPVWVSEINYTPNVLDVTDHNGAASIVTNGCMTFKGEVRLLDPEFVKSLKPKRKRNPAAPSRALKNKIRRYSEK